MKHFVENKTGNVFGYDSVEQADLISGLDLSLYTAITKLPTTSDVWNAKTKTFKVDAAKAAADLIATHNDPILAKIHALESAQTSRLLREVSLGNVASKKKLAKMDVAIAKLRATLKK